MAHKDSRGMQTSARPEIAWVVSEAVDRALRARLIPWRAHSVSDLVGQACRARGRCDDVFSEFSTEELFEIDELVSAELLARGWRMDYGPYGDAENPTVVGLPFNIPFRLHRTRD